MTQPAHRVVQISVIDWANSLNGKPPIGADLARLIATLAAAVEADRASTHAHISERIVDASAIRPYTWAYRYHDCVRFNGGEQVNGSRPQGSFPLFDQKAIDMAVAAERERCAKIAEPKGPRPCDCEYGACYCRNAGDAAAVASWDADMAVARAIRAPVSGSTEAGK